VGKTAKAADPAKAAAAPPADPADPALKVDVAPAPAATAPAAGHTPGVLFDENGQREAMLAQVRAQLGDVPERYIEFKPGPDGLSMRWLPPLSEIMRKYEACRRAREPGAQCGAVRDQAIAKLSEPSAAPAAAAAPTPAAATARTRPGKTKASAKGEAAAPIPDAAAAHEPNAAAPEAAAARADNEPHLVSEPQAPAATPGPIDPAPVKAETKPVPTDRAGLEQKAAEDHAVCMKLKPKFECEQARARALGTLERPKAPKPAKAAKQAKAASPQVATAPAQ